MPDLPGHRGVRQERNPVDVRPLGKPFERRRDRPAKLRKKQLKTENLYLLKAEVCDNMNIRGIRPGKFSLLLRTVRARDQKEVKT